MDNILAVESRLPWGAGGKRYYGSLVIFATIRAGFICGIDSRSNWQIIATHAADETCGASAA
jgi:hypothetical protein